MCAMRRSLLTALASLAFASPAGAQEAARLVSDVTVGFAPSDYPPEALRAREQGRAVAEVEVGADGLARGCAVVVSSGSASLDAATCRGAIALTFAPARDTSGTPQVGRVQVPVRWVLPVAPAGLERVTIVSGAAALRCTVQRGGRERVLRPEPCEDLHDAVVRAGQPGDHADIAGLPDSELAPQ
jgi:TonB family protein